MKNYYQSLCSKQKKKKKKKNTGMTQNKIIRTYLQRIFQIKHRLLALQYYFTFQREGLKTTEMIVLIPIFINEDV